MLVFIVVCMFTFTLIFSQYWKRRHARQKRMRELLVKKYSEARTRRTQYEEQHEWFFFGYPEYEELWEAEIGAQDIYIIFGGINIPSSLIEYCARREKFENERNE